MMNNRLSSVVRRVGVRHASGKEVLFGAEVRGISIYKPHNAI
jgi:hypothetical protein